MNKYEKMNNKKVDTPMRGDLEYGQPQRSTEMGVRSEAPNSHKATNSWPAGGIVKTVGVGIEHSYRPGTESVRDNRGS